MAVDWSGARRPAGRLWAAQAHDGRVTALVPLHTRDQALEHVAAAAAGGGEPLVVGLDFSFSFPAWFLRREGLASAAELWALAGREGEAWLRDCPPPFWGRPGHRRPDLPAHLRRTERRCPAVGGVRPTSSFQIGGAGSVGTGSVRGMPYLAALRRAGFAVWPFDAPGPATVLELYPRLLTGPVVKSRPAARRAVADALAGRGALTPAQADVVAAGADAFDAAVAALGMSERTAELAALRRSGDPLVALEGEMWVPAAPPATAVGKPPAGGPPSAVAWA